MMTKGQLLSQSGFARCASGQQSMSLGIPAISSICETAFDDMSVIATSAATVLTGAISIPSRAASGRRRARANMYFIAFMIGMARGRWEEAHENVVQENLGWCPPASLAGRCTELAGFAHSSFTRLATRGNRTAGQLRL